MPDPTRIICTLCKRSVFTCFIEGADGQLYRVPIAHRINSGQPSDTGPAVPLDDPNVRVTSFTREFLQTRVAAMNLCEKCFGEAFGLPFVSATEDPMFLNVRANSQLQRKIERVLESPDIDDADKHALMHARTLHALSVGWGEKTASELPAELIPVDDGGPQPPARKKISDLSDEDLAALGLQRIPSTASSVG